MTNRLFLHGQYRQKIGDKLIGFQKVPGSYPPVGECVLEYEFELPWKADEIHRYFLVAEGVMAGAAFTLNGTELGTAGPFCRYRFEIPKSILKDRNTVGALVKDLNESFGTTPGRLFEAGINRSIYIERRPDAFIEDFFFQTELDNDLTGVSCSLTPEINGEYSGEVEVTLTEVWSGKQIIQTSGPVDAPLVFRAEEVSLWSPETPKLYTLSVTLPGKKPDTICENVGFRKIEIRGSDFFLNKQRLILKGVCRHEFTSGSGYCPSYEETERELAMIKHAGFNYVRLVHSPQSPEVSRIAAALGIFVSEEPGTCWHNLGDEIIAAPAVEALRRTVMRDRNIPSVFAWLIYNECDPNVGYAKRVGQMVRELDPGRLISMADCSGNEELVKEMVREGDLSYYGINHYATAPRNYVDIMDLYTDRPLVFTEWGGCHAQGSRRFLENLCRGFVCHTREDEEHRLAGCAFWAWADYPERSRGRFAAPRGWTVEGLLDKKGCPKADLQILSQMCFSIDYPPSQAEAKLEMLQPGPAREEPWEVISLAYVETNQSELEEAIGISRGAYLGGDWWYETGPEVPLPPPTFGRILSDGIEFLCRDAGEHNHPLILGKGNEEIVIAVNRNASAIAVLGHTAFAGGYPSSDVSSVFHKDTEEKPERGDIAAEYELVFEDGTETIPLRHGIEILRSNNICRWWDTAPLSEAVKPAVQVTVFESHEVLRADLWKKIFNHNRQLKEVRWRLKDKNAVIMMYGMSVRGDASLVICRPTIP